MYRYVYHFLKSKEFDLQNSQVGAGIPSVSLKDINNLTIAVPPLEVKCEIVHIYENDILYTYVGTVGQVGLVDKNNKYYLAPNVARIRIADKNVLPKYVMYFLLTDEFKKKQLDVLSGTSSMKNITMANIRKFKIPVPSIEEQQRVIDILEKFDRLSNDISEGLPAEIDARQKQYEYYRDKLLTFKELKQ